MQTTLQSPVLAGCGPIDKDRRNFQVAALQLDDVSRFAHVLCGEPIYGPGHKLAGSERLLKDTQKRVPYNFKERGDLMSSIGMGMVLL